MKKSVLGVALGAVLSASLWNQTAHAQTVKPTGVANLKQQIAASKGKVTIVNFWATWCLPCVKEMPALSKLRKNYAARGLNLVLVSANTSSEMNTVKPFMKAHALPSSWMVSGSLDAFAKSFDPKLKTKFLLPRTYVYNRQGKLVQSFAVDKNYAEWEALVKKYL